MTRLLTVFLSLGLVSIFASDGLSAPKKKKRSGEKAVEQRAILDGISERVFWNDGDSMRIVDGPRKGQKARLVGYNTVESYGPVHFWGDASGWDIYRIHKEATEFARSQEWECETQGSVDGYGRILVLCPELRRQLIANGLAHVYAYGSEIPDPELVRLQHQAQNERKGMWKWGIPRAIVTSIHSIDEERDDLDRRNDKADKKSYNRLADTATGKTFAVAHEAVFRPCDVFCHSGSCMIYVPFNVRYGEERPSCLLGKEGDRNRMDGPNHLLEPLKRE